MRLSFLNVSLFFPKAKIIKKQCGPNRQVKILIITSNIVYSRNP